MCQSQLCTLFLHFSFFFYMEVLFLSLNKGLVKALLTFFLTNRVSSVYTEPNRKKPNRSVLNRNLTESNKP